MKEREKISNALMISFQLKSYFMEAQFLFFVEASAMQPLRLSESQGSNLRQKHKLKNIFPNQMKTANGIRLEPEAKPFLP